MSPAKPARKPRASSARPATETTVALADLTITWHRRRRFATDPKDGADLTITGAQLAAVLGVLAEEEPQGNWDEFGDPKDIADSLESLNEVLFGLAVVEDLETSEALAWLTRYVRGLVAGLRGHRERDAILKDARVTIAKPAAAGASSRAEPDAAGKIAAYDAAQKIVDAVKAGKGKVA